MPAEHQTVYTTESGRICPNCGRPVADCICKKANAHPAGNGIVRVARESKGRKGKTVTLISGVPLNGEALHALASDLKRQCGTGGSVKDGIIEIQGDQRETVAVALKKRGFTVKLPGG